MYAYINQIRHHLVEGKISEALRLLRALLQNTPLLNEAIQQSARYADICRQVRLGVVGYKEAQLTQNQISWGVLELLSELEQQGGAPCLDRLLAVVEEKVNHPGLQQEVTKAISVVNSKNVVVGTHISAMGNVHIGDIYIGNPSDLPPESPGKRSSPQIFRPIGFKILRRDKSLRWYQRLFFGLVKKGTGQELALKTQGIFDAEERRFFLNALQHYIPLHFTDEINKFPRSFSNIFFQTLTQKENDGKFYLLLGETGMGKSTALLELFTRFALTQRAYEVVFTNFSKDLEPVFQLPNPEKTILLLDGIDEAPGMLDDPEAFFAKVENSVRNFAKVIISCRTQFFVNKAAERSKTSTKLPKNYHKVYLDFLEMETVQLYLGKRYRAGTIDFIAAMSMVKRTGNLFRRPLLLSYIFDMVEQKDDFLFYKAPKNSNADASGTVTQYEIYQTILDKWMEREALLNPSLDGDYRRVLHTVSMKLAQAIFYPENRTYVYYSDLKNIAEKYRLPISDTLLRDRSLLHRNEQGYYNFAHRTFKEFFFAQLLYDGLISEEEFPFDAYEDTERFYNEMGEVKYFQQITDEIRRKNHRPGKISFPAIKNTCLPRPLIVFCQLEGIPVSENIASLFEGLLWKAQFGDKHLDCLTDLALYFVRESADMVDEDYLRIICKPYDVYIGDLLQPFFFCQTGNNFHFIHRSFAEYLCLRDMMHEPDMEDAADAAARFPFDRLRFKRLFAQEIRWLRFLPYRRNVSLYLDNYTVSEEDFQSSGASTWYGYYQSKSGVIFSEFFQRLERGEGRLCLRAQRAADNDFLACIPFAEHVRELNLAHNDLKGDIRLEHFVRLQTLYLDGNPEMNLLKLPASLKIIVQGKREADIPVPVGFKGDVQYRREVVQLIAGNEQSLPEMVEVKGGRFWMGSAEEDESAQKDEMPRHLVAVSDFFIAKYPVTTREFACFVQETGYVTQAEREGWALASWWDKSTLRWYLNVGTDWTRDVYGKPIDAHFALHPVIYVSWHDAKAYCEWLSQKTGKQYGLPSEAQWEYAAIGGGCSGRRDDAGNIAREYEYAGSDDWKEVAWCFDRFRDSSVSHSQFSTRPVGLLKPNELGLYDMNGNVWEWCEDWYDEKYYEVCQDKSIVEDPPGPVSGSGRVLRGGGWPGNAEYCRAASRYGNYPALRNLLYGFRLVFVP
jgi:formylglycine-generating enzyme required for sulfatase activity